MSKKSPAPAAKVIRITCDPDRRLERLPLASLEAFQGDLKTLNEVDAEKLRRSLIRLGYSFPTTIWHGHQQIIDGHQRNRMLASLLDAGWALVESNGSPAAGVPVVAVVAASEQEAAEKVLAAASVYGQATEGSVTVFLERFSLNLADLDFPALPDVNWQSLSRMADGEAPDQSADLQTRFSVLIVCAHEAEQVQLIERLTSEGLTCKALLT